MKKFLTVVFSFIIMHASVKAQELAWYDPLSEDFGVVEGQGWQNIAFNRLPDTAKEVVREPVWGLSRNAAGLLLRFTTGANEIKVEFTPGPRLSMPHMPSTGVSGLDLYARDGAGAWMWVRGKYHFGKDKVSYSFITPDNPAGGKEYLLYLPLYNSLSDLKIGVEESKDFGFMPKREAPPIVVYGTSIAQGACASRPGMAWTNIVGRALEVPMVNLAFSGNGRLEPEVLDYVKAIDASVFVLDCLPNLGPWGGYTEKVVKDKILQSVKMLKTAHPATPVLLVEHAGYSDGWIDADRKSAYTNLNKWTESCFQELKEAGVQGLFLLSHGEIGMGNDDFVDGTHPTDLGMQRYADAYIKKLSEILKEQ
ncbi:hydrolase [Echinicola soli]|uniref:Hydrolase n=1 Tax=Echinicola soli TaxID=2591634 RepID=A0A514CJM2_9BACT|nr:SGNH/GDSL hydrolase family protein [Echinicola soli]QDH80031.1 hydrolase [Echinicola soli]